MPYDPNNIFAKILRGDLPCVKVYEDEHTLALMDIMPSVEGHTLVIPKAPAKEIFDLSADGAAALIRTTQKIARAVKRGLNCSGIMLVQLNGPGAGQSIPHVHFHVLPREEGVDMQLHGRAMKTLEDLEPVAAKIRDALSSGGQRSSFPGGTDPD
jgi:histidine triad (HIT) family protein